MMKSVLMPVELDIDVLPQLNHPLVKAFADIDVELSEQHVQCIYDAIEYADKVLYGR